MSFFDGVEDAYEKGRNAEYMGEHDIVYKGGFPIGPTAEERRAFIEGWYETHGTPIGEAEFEEGAWDL